MNQSELGSDTPKQARLVFLQPRRQRRNAILGLLEHDLLRFADFASESDTFAPGIPFKLLKQFSEFRWHSTPINVALVAHTETRSIKSDSLPFCNRASAKLGPLIQPAVHRAFHVH